MIMKSEVWLGFRNIIERYTWTSKKVTWVKAKTQHMIKKIIIIVALIWTIFNLPFQVFHRLREIMADLDDFFAKKDKKKKTKKGFSKANTDVLAKNLEINEKKEQQAEEKANDASRNLRIKETQPEVANDVSITF